MRTLPFLIEQALFRLAVGSDWSLNTESDWPVIEIKELFDGIVSQDQLASLVCMK
jgi:hypothetical protein